MEFLRFLPKLKNYVSTDTVSGRISRRGDKQRTDEEGHFDAAGLAAALDALRPVEERRPGVSALQYLAGYGALSQREIPCTHQVKP